MAKSLSCFQHLLGSLQGQLQLANYLSVFVGFTGASGVRLWAYQLNLTGTAVVVTGQAGITNRPPTTTRSKTTIEHMRIKIEP